MKTQKLPDGARPLEPAYDSEAIWQSVRHDKRRPCLLNGLHMGRCDHSECGKAHYRTLLKGEETESWRDPNGPDTPPAKALTYDDGKAPLAQLPWAAIEGLAMVQAYGHAKYKDFNNYRKGMEVSRNISCVLRHVKEYMEGHDVDAESGRHPLEHALTRLAFVLQNLHDGTAIDDRYKPGPA